MKKTDSMFKLEVMSLLGCVRIKGRDDQYMHQDFPGLIFDMSAIDPHKIIIKLSQIFQKVGYRECQSDVKRTLNIT